VFMLTDFLFIGPCLHVWYDLLNRGMMYSRYRRRTGVSSSLCALCHQLATRAIAKMLVDQTIGVCIFFPLYLVCIEITESVIAARVTYGRTLAPASHR
jgi:hypothetical protein